jgi:hypothetical protein
MSLNNNLIILYIYIDKEFIMSSYEFNNGAQITFGDEACDCYEQYDYADCNCKDTLNIKIKGDYYTTTIDDDKEEIEKLQKFLMDFWYTLEKKKRDIEK